MNYIKALILTAIFFGEAAHAQTPIDEMTCAQAQEQARQTNRYYLRTESGQIIPIYGVHGYPKRGDYIKCKGAEFPRFDVHETADMRRCPVAYICAK